MLQSLLELRQGHEQRKAQLKKEQRRISVENASGVLATSIWDQRFEQDTESYRVYIGRKPELGYTTDYLSDVASAALKMLDDLGRHDVEYNPTETDLECRRKEQGYGNRIGDYDRNNLYIVIDRLPLAAVHQIAEARLYNVEQIAQAS